MHLRVRSPRCPGAARGCLDFRALGPSMQETAQPSGPALNSGMGSEAPPPPQPRTTSGGGWGRPTGGPGLTASLQHLFFAD